MTDLPLLLDGRLWPGFTLASHPLLIAVAGEALYCVGRCVPGLTGPLRADEIAGRFPAQYSFVSGTSVGLADEQTVVVVTFDPKRDDPKTIVFTAIHEGFHAYYQLDRENDVPLEMRLPDNPQAGAYASRAELQNAYTAKAERNGLLSHEIRALAWAARAGAEARTEDAGALACVDEFIELRQIRHRDLPTPNVEEDIWERTEGIPLYLERAAAALLGHPDTSVLGQSIDYDAVPDLSMVPYFSITGALEAVILDQLERDAWRTWVFPGRSGEGLALFDAVVRARNALPHVPSTPCPANAGAHHEHASSRDSHRRRVRPRLRCGGSVHASGSRSRLRSAFTVEVRAPRGGTGVAGRGGSHEASAPRLPRRQRGFATPLLHRSVDLT